tara:strand:- start:24 stop:173 length:150 start_codon:yes stop_codon:yes gene_type:complete
LSSYTFINCKEQEDKKTEKIVRTCSVPFFLVNVAVVDDDDGDDDDEDDR